MFGRVPTIDTTTGRLRITQTPAFGGSGSAEEDGSPDGRDPHLGSDGGADRDEQPEDRADRRLAKHWRGEPDLERRDHRSNERPAHPVVTDDRDPQPGDVPEQRQQQCDTEETRLQDDDRPVAVV